MKGISRKLAAGAMALVFAVSCSTAATPPPGASQAPLVGGTLQLRMRAGIGTLNPTVATLTQTALIVLSSLYDTVTALDPKTGESIPYLAKSWTKDASKITFQMRTDAVCADGTKVTPTVVRNSLDRFVKTSNAAVTTFGPGPFTITADDAAGTLVFQSAVPNSEMIGGFSNGNASIVCPAGLVDLKAQDRKSFGSGPYLIDSVVENATFTVKLRPEWKWGPQDRTAQTPGFPDTIIFKSVENDTTAANLLLTGGLDVGEMFGPDIERLKAEKSLTYTSIPNAIASPLLFNMTPGRPAADKAVREAIIMSIDKAKYNQAAYLGLGSVPTGGFVVKGNRCYDESLAALIPQYDPVKAKQTLVSAGYQLGPNGKFLGKDGKPLVINVVGQQIIRSGPEFLAESLNAVGFTTTLRQLNTIDYGANIRLMDSDLVPFTIGGPTVSYSNYIPFISGGTLVTRGGVNRSGLFDPIVDKAYADYLAAATPADECKFMSAFQRRMFEERYTAPYIAGTFDWFSRGFTIARPQTHVWQFLRTR